VEETGSSHVPRGTVCEGVKLRAWTDAQGVKWKAGSLSEERVEALEGIDATSDDDLYPITDQAVANLPT
jgi:hypothetical protein